LQHPHGQQQDRGGDADLAVVGQQADGHGRQAHQDDGDQKGGLAPGLVAVPAEHQGAQRPHHEADPEGQQGQDIGGRLAHIGIEMLGDDRCQRAEDEEVVPFEGRAGRRGSDHRLQARSLLFRLGHFASPRFRPRL